MSRAETLTADSSQEVQNTQTPSLAETYEQIYPGLIRTLNRIAGEVAGDTPEDIVQKAALRLLPPWESYMECDGSNPEGLFYKTSLRLQRDAGRKIRKNTYDKPIDTSRLIIADETAEQAFREVERVDNPISKLCMVAGLSDRQFKMIVMRYI